MVSESAESGEAEVPGEWSFMIDPAWRPADGGDEPPWEAVVGGWFVQEDSEVSLFRPNPSYQPSEPGLPTDPVDAALQLLARGGGDADGLLASLQDVLLGVAIDEHGRALVERSPDEVPSVLVATAPPHRARVDAAGWREVTVAQLAEALPPEGVDVLLNPGAPASVRLMADAVRATFAGAGNEIRQRSPGGEVRGDTAERSWESVVAEAGTCDDKSWRVAGKVLASTGIRADPADPDPERARRVDQLRRVVAAELARTGDHRRAAALANHHGVALGLRLPGTASP